MKPVSGYSIRFANDRIQKSEWRNDGNSFPLFGLPCQLSTLWNTEFWNLVFFFEKDEFWNYRWFQRFLHHERISELAAKTYCVVYNSVACKCGQIRSVLADHCPVRQLLWPGAGSSLILLLWASQLRMVHVSSSSAAANFNSNASQFNRFPG